MIMNILICSTLVIIIGILLTVVNVCYITGWCKEDIDLAVCILSSRNDHDLRSSIRQSWLTDISRLKTQQEVSIVAKFVVGTMACPIHTEDRSSPYGCEKWEPVIPQEQSKALSAFALTPLDVSDKFLTVSIIYFKVLHPILLRRLGIAEFLPLENTSMNTSVEVVLMDAVTEEEMAHSSFSSSQRGSPHHGYSYRPVPELILPKIRTLALKYGHNTGKAGVTGGNCPWKTNGYYAVAIPANKRNPKK